MKYCIDFLQECHPILNKVDEINIKYNKKNTHILEFIQEHPNQTINVCLENIEDIKTFTENKEIKNIKFILEQHPDYKLRVRIPDISDCREIFKQLKENNIPTFDSKCRRSWDGIYEAIAAGVSDIYVVDELGFDLKNVRRAVGNNIQIRVFPHIAQSSAEVPDLKKFFIRPEDIDLYEPVVDVCELRFASKKANTLYDIYANDKKWYGKLNELITGFNSDLDSRYIVPAFGQQRIKCEKKCFKGNKCTLCERVDLLAKVLEKNNLLIKVDKEDSNGERTNSEGTDNREDISNI